MMPGSRIRGTAKGLALVALSAMAGCHASPLGRVTTSPNRPQSTLASTGRAALLPATVAMDPPSEMSSIEPVESPASSLTLAEPPRPAPTPLLDAALERARGLDGIIAGEMARPDDPAALPPAPGVVLPPTNVGPPAPTIPPGPEPASVTPTPTPATVEVPAGPKPKEPEPPRPEELWRDGVRRLGSLARAKLEQSGGPASPWGLRARVLAWLAEPDIDPDAGQHEADAVRAVLRALDDAPADSPRRGDEVRSAILVLEDKAPLEIVDLRMCSKVRGFGDFEAFEPPVRKAGEPVILYCEIDGLRSEQTAAGYRTRVAAQFEIVPEGGGPPILTRPLSTAEETCRRRRRDYYIAYKLVMPRPHAPGDYRIRLTVKDLTSDRSTTREVAFAIARD